MDKLENIYEWRYKNESKKLYDKTFMRAYLERYIFGIIKKEQIPEIAHGLIKKYLKDILSKPDFNIFDEQSVSDIMQLIYSERTLNRSTKHF